MSGPLEQRRRRGGRGRWREDAGVATVTFLFIGMIVILAAAALLGGGAVFAARVHGYDLAQAAARAGAQCLDTATYRQDGIVRLEQAAATRAATDVLTRAGATGTVAFPAPDRITVTATSRQPTPMLAAFGIHTVDVTVTASAAPATAPPT